MAELREGRQRASLKNRISRFFSKTLGPGAGEQHEGEHIHANSLQLSKTGLHHARVLSQLDFKFILCTMEVIIPSTLESQQSCTVLVVIDQHAADERVRVERMMKVMCACSSSAQNDILCHSTTAALETSLHGQGHGDTVHTLPHRLDSMAMIPALPITLSKREWKLVDQYADWLFRWGIAVSMCSNSSEAGDLRRPSDPSLQEDLIVEAEPMMVSHHFSEEAGSMFQNESSTLNPKPPTKPSHHPITFQAKHASLSTGVLGSDLHQGYVTALPRIVADRCVVDHALAQDLIKDSISMVEETQYSSGRTTTDSQEHSPNGMFDRWEPYRACVRYCCTPDADIYGGCHALALL